jgi:MFS family permease
VPERFPTSLVVAGFAVSFVMIGGGINTVGVLLNAIAAETHWARSALSLAVGVGAVVAALATPAVGVAVDRVGVRAPMLAGAALLALGFALCVRMQTPWHFVAANLFLGAGFAAGALFPITLAITLRAGERAALAIGIAAAGSSLGSFALMPALQALVDAVGWRATYVAMGCAVVATPLPLVAFVLPRGRLAPGGRGPEAARPPSGPPARGRAAPITRAELRRPGVRPLAAILVLPGLVTFAVSVHLVPYLTGQGLSGRLAAATLGSAVGFSVIGKIAGGFVADRIGALPTLRAALALGVAALACLPAVKAPALLGAFVLCYGAYLGTSVSVTPVLARAVLGEARFGSQYGALQLGAMLAAAAGPVAAGALYDATGGYEEALALWIAAMAAALAVALRMRVEPAAAFCAPAGTAR